MAAGKEQELSTVDGYIAGFPREVQRVLKALRKTIRTAAPGAEESISYRIPTYKLHGPVVYFAAFKSHIGLYPITAPAKERFARELSKYKGGQGTVQFPLDEPLPLALIASIVKFLVQQDAQRSPSRASGRQRRGRGRRT